MSPLNPTHLETTTTSGPRGSSGWVQIVSWIVSWILAVGLVVAQLATILASSKTAWFRGLCCSIGLFGSLAFVRYSISRRQRHRALLPDLSRGPNSPEAPPADDHSWNWFALAAMMLLLLVGLAKAPHRSNDVYAYGAYGRLVSEHSVSPYATRPSAFPKDPVIARMEPGWRNTRSVYGPAFTAVSALGMNVAGTSELIERLWFQTLAAAATGFSALLLQRMSPRHWWLFALNPVTLIVVAHEGHNDALVGLGILSALWFAKRALKSPQKNTQLIHGAIGSLVFAASIKITAILAFPAIAMWILGRLGWRRTARICSGWVLVCLSLFAATGGPSAFAAFRGLRTFRSTTSLWHLNAIRQLTDRTNGEPGVLALTLPALLITATGFLVLCRCWSASRVPHLGQPSKRVQPVQEVQPVQPAIRETLFDTRAYDCLMLVSMTLLLLVVFITMGLYILPWYWGWLLAPAVLLPTTFRSAVMVAAAAHSLAYGAGTVVHGSFATVLHIARLGTPLAFVVTVAIGLTAVLHRDRANNANPTVSG